MSKARDIADSNLDNLTVDTNTLVIDSTNNRVGIGTTSPSESLEVNGNIFVNTSGNPSATIKTSGAGNNPKLRLQAASNYWDLEGIFSNATDDLFFGYNGSTKVAISNAGNVGIGTSSPDRQLSVNNFSGNGTVSINASTTGASTLYFADGNTGTDIYTGFIQYNHSSNAMQFATNGGSERMRIDSSGNIGIGTSSLSNGVKAVIQGSQTGGAAATSGTTQTYGLLRLQGTTFTSALDMGTNGGNYAWIQSTDQTNLGTNYSLAINPNGGSVGIGTTASVTNSILNVDGGVNVVNGIIGYATNDAFTLNGRTQPHYGCNFASTSGSPAGISGYYGLAFATSQTERMRIDSSGNVGIGTSTFNATYNPKLQVTSDQSDGTGGVLIQNYLPTLTLEDISGGAATSQIQQDQTSMLFKNGGSERMRINSSGRVDVNDSLLVYNNLEVGAGAGTHGKINSQTPGTFEYFIDKGLSYRGVCDGSFGGYLLLVPAYTSGTVVGKKFYGEIIADRGNTGNGNSTSWAKVLAATAYNNDKLLLKVMGSSQYFTATHKVTYSGTQYLALRFAVSGGGPVNSFHAKGHVMGEDSNFLFMARDSEVSNVISFGTRILDI